jgi:hypothetical protein
MAEIGDNLMLKIDEIARNQNSAAGRMYRTANRCEYQGTRIRRGSFIVGRGQEVSARFCRCRLGVFVLMVALVGAGRGSSSRCAGFRRKRGCGGQHCHSKQNQKTQTNEMAHK